MKDKAAWPILFEWFKEDFIKNSFPESFFEFGDPCCPCCGERNLKYRRNMHSCANRACPIFLGFASWDFVTPFPFTKKAVGIWLDNTSEPAFIVPKEIKNAKKWAEDVIKREIVEAQQKSIEFGIYDIIRNIVGKGKNINSGEAEWESCRIVFEQVGVATNTDSETSITMPDGTILYCALEGGKKITQFRHGEWVERIKKYSNQITVDRQHQAEIEAKNEREAELKSFSKIDF